MTFQTLAPVSPVAVAEAELAEIRSAFVDRPEFLDRAIAIFERQAYTVARAWAEEWRLFGEAVLSVECDEMIRQYGSMEPQSEREAAAWHAYWKRVHHARSYAMREAR